jgi:hypothetical protein
MNYDFTNVQETQNFVTVPEGTHVCQVAEVRPGTTKEGAERWSLRLVVATGDHAGHTAAWDALVWNDKCAYRVKRALEALGFDVAGETSIEPQDLVGRRARVTLNTSRFEDPATGRVTERLEVPFLGYAPADGTSDGTHVGAHDGAHDGTHHGDDRPDGPRTPAVAATGSDPF